ncbi:MAG: hypothetical protein GY859_21405, partial [Desulfobacterales bacterium]|nr:hypothetical protein [Desulfobacterales bacterium]
MSNPILHVRCWRCKKKFHMRVWKEDCNPDGPLVSKLVPCPYCETDRAVTLTEAEAGSMLVKKGEKAEDVEKRLVHEAPVDAFAGQVFETIRPEKETNSVQGLKGSFVEPGQNSS